MIGAVMAMVFASLVLARVPTPKRDSEPPRHVLAEGAQNKAEGPKTRRLVARNTVPSYVRRAQRAYDLPKVVKASISCRNHALDAKQYLLAARCGVMVFYAQRDLGNARGEFLALKWAEDHPDVQAAQRKHGANPGLDAYEAVDVARLSKSIPKFTATLKKGSFTIPYVQDAGKKSIGRTSPAKDEESSNRLPHQLRVRMTVDGKPVMAYVDTGQATIPLFMDKQHAKMLGVRLLVSGLGPVWTLNSRSQYKQSAFGLVRKMTLGPLTLQNVLVTVVPNRPAAGGLSIGLSALARFHTIEFTRHAILVGMTTAPCTQPLPLWAAKPSTGNPVLLFAAHADGKVVAATIDTGSRALLIAGSGLAPPGNHSDPKAAPHLADKRPAIKRRYLAVRIGKMRLSSPGVPVIPWLNEIDVDIGAPILARNDIWINFTRPSLCIVRRGD